MDVSRSSYKSFYSDGAFDTTNSPMESESELLIFQGMAYRRSLAWVDMKKTGTNR